MRNVASRIAVSELGKPIAVFNRCNWQCRDVVSVKVRDEAQHLRVVDSDGQEIPSSVRAVGDGRELSLVATVPPLGYAVYHHTEDESAGNMRTEPCSGNTIENEFYRLTADDGTGLVTSLFDKSLQLVSPRGGDLPCRQTLLPLEGEHVAVTAIKQAHAGGDLIARLFESRGEPSRVRIPEADSHGIADYRRSNILEEKVEAYVTEAGSDGFSVTPWEILSLRLSLKPRGSSVTWKWGAIELA